jgi:hypothetical protein
VRVENIHQRKLEKMRWGKKVVKFFFFTSLIQKKKKVRLNEISFNGVSQKEACSISLRNSILLMNKIAQYNKQTNNAKQVILNTSNKVAKTFYFTTYLLLMVRTLVQHSQS